MNARFLFSFVSLSLALVCALIGEWRADTEIQSHTDILVYGIVSPIGAFAMSSGIQFSPFKRSNLSHFPRFFVVGLVTILLSCVGKFIVLANVQPMGFVSGALFAIVVLINQFFWVGVLYIPLLIIVSCLLFSFGEESLSR